MIQDQHAADTTIEATEERLGRLQRNALILGVVGLLGAVAGVLLNLDQVFRSYLFAYLFWLGITLGCLVWLLIHDITGGRWGRAIRPMLEAGALTIVLMALLFIPLLFGLDRLYSWAQPEIVAQDAALQHKEPYLNVPFFIGRAAIYFVVWAGAIYLLRRWWLMQATNPTARIAERLRRFSGPALALYGVTVTFGSFDWLMSLDPHWFSTVFGILIAAGQALTALALVIVVVNYLNLAVPRGSWLTRSDLGDLGNFLLTAVIFWSYIAFMQYFIIWSGNLPEDVLWYLHRLEGGWRWIPGLLLVIHFALPFALLLSGALKRNPRALAAVALLLLFGELLHVYWLVAPTYSHSQLRVHWLDVVLPILIGGLWIAAFAWQLRRRLRTSIAPIVVVESVE